MNKALTHTQLIVIPLIENIENLNLISPSNELLILHIGPHESYQCKYIENPQTFKRHCTSKQRCESSQKISCKWTIPTFLPCAVVSFNRRFCVLPLCCWSELQSTSLSSVAWTRSPHALGASNPYRMPTRNTETLEPQANPQPEQQPQSSCFRQSNWVKRPRIVVQRCTRVVVCVCDWGSGWVWGCSVVTGYFWRALWCLSRLELFSDLGMDCHTVLYWITFMFDSMNAFMWIQENLHWYVITKSKSRFRFRLRGFPNSVILWVPKCWVKLEYIKN